jgi:hypothetical protein
VLIRNTEWSRTLIADMATYGKYPVDWSKEEMLRAAVPSYDIGMYEQNMLVWRLMNEPDIMAKVGDCLLTSALTLNDIKLQQCMTHQGLLLEKPSRIGPVSSGGRVLKRGTPQRE